MIEEERTSGDLESSETATTPAPDRPLTLEAQRALAEAAERRAAEDRARAAIQDKAKEVGGRDGPEPTRFGDWEKGGIASDF